MTNGERIRQMTDEELAKLIGRYSPCINCASFPNSCNENCVFGVLQWLKQEATDE